MATPVPRGLRLQRRPPPFDAGQSTPTRLRIPLASAERLDRVKLPVKAGYALLVDPALTEVVEHRSTNLLSTTTDSCIHDVVSNHTRCELTRCRHFSLKAELSNGILDPNESESVPLEVKSRPGISARDPEELRKFQSK